MKIKLNSLQITLILAGIGAVILVLIIFFQNNNQPENIEQPVGNNNIAGEINYQNWPTVGEQEVAESNYLDSNQVGKNAGGFQISFSGREQSWPAQLPIGEKSGYELSEAEVVERVTNLLEMKRPVGVDYNYWSNSTFYLTYSRQTKVFELARNNYQPTTQIVNSAQAQQIAVNFFSQFFPDVEIEVLPNQIIFLKNNNQVYSDVAAPSEATLINLSLANSFAGWPVFLQKNESAPYRILISGDNSIVSASFSLLSNHFTEVGESARISLEQAIQSINNGEGILVTIDDTNEELEPINTLLGVSGELDQVAIRYRIVGERLLPFYELSGELKDQQGVVFQGTIITPAVRTEALWFAGLGENR